MFIFIYIELRQHLVIASSLHHNGIVRTTVDLDEEILRAAKDLARERSQSLGRVLSDLARRGLEPPSPALVMRNGVPLLPRKPGAAPVTSQAVKDLLEMEN
jgi:hypothetical protein